ncbi:AzlC family ABC transporter permease [Rivibacter subsaxonicus]|uniref:Putative branched-subunit amino acid permease n=1 Tax=Rivibacter subsaxonicus TaxID=457575 RepID=A0A4Q7VV92_9BURK|nr:AzlC family ABC transporter permease [Rivibacter subsaxonicus]RZU00584.1 putative branched-subunit amino acid permease [Rivibacter subsaxonicus]
MSLAAPDWRTTVRHPAFRVGAREMLGPSIGVAAWGLVTGVAMVKGGLSVPLALLINFTVFAGSAQLATVPLIVSGAPVWVIWATAFCVNLRFVIFSAQWRPYFLPYPRPLRLLLGYFAGDINYVLFMKRFAPAGTAGGAELEQSESPAAHQEQLSYFWGSVLTNYSAWQIPSVIGILLAEAIPTQWGLGFAGTLALLGLAYSLLSDRATMVSAIVAGGAAVAAFALPFKLNIVVAIAAAVCVGLFIDGSGDAGRRLRVMLTPDRRKPRDGSVRAMGKLA